jgi:regulator of protease activity HflC (stomatin/prohibitin superfamily)
MEEQDRQGPPPFPSQRTGKFKLPQLSGISSWFFWLAVIGVAALLFFWFGCRIEPGSGEIAILIKKTGEDLHSGQIIAQKPEQKGIQLEVLPEGRYFKNPYTWGWKINRITDIPAGKLGIVTRLFGKDLPPSQIIAGEGTKGILAEVLRPGKYRLNPYAFRVQMFDAITIRPGKVGVLTSLVGEDVLNNELSEDYSNTFLVTDGMKGVLPNVIDPGSYYLNPFMFNVVEVNLRSQRFEMSGKDVISFLTLDGFTVTVEGTIEFALQRDRAALLTHRVGDMDDIIKKIILPRARGFSRIEGSKHPAIDFIVGETRQKFQNDLESHLQVKSVDWGVDIKSVLVRKIVVPDAIASITRAREVAVREAKKYQQEIEQARSKAELVKQEMLAQQNKEKVEAETARIRAVISAQQDQAVRIVAAQKELQVGKLSRQAAEFQADAVLLTAKGQRDAIQKRNEAEAAVMALQVKAFGEGMDLARYTFYQRSAPQIRSILSSDESEGLGTIFGAYLPRGKEGSQ